jgi:DNA (cytosine-5)-methyltransferase 1
VDFFCGAGGTTRGLLDAGGYVIAGIDKDGRCARTYVDNNVNASLDYCSARFLKYDIFRKAPDYPTGQQNELFQELDGLIAYYRGKVPAAPLLFAICAPCQPFTKLSRSEMSLRRVETHQRDRHLLLEACKFVAKYEPELVLSENVAGISDQKYGGVWDRFRIRLEKLGYLTGSKIVCTSRFGIPQFRKRSMLAAVRRELTRADRVSDLLQDELLIPDRDPGARQVSVAEAIGYLPRLEPGTAHPTIPNHKARALSDINAKRLMSARPGQSNSYMEDTRYGDLALPCHKRVNRKFRTRCFNDVYTRMDPRKPAPTITTRCHSISNGRFGHFDVSQVRALSIREAAIIQSFPNDYVFYPEDEMEPLARMIGNAVPPKLAEYFARYLLDSLA